MTILNEDSLDNKIENAKEFVNKLREVEELIKVRKYESAATFLQVSKPYCITAQSHLGNSLYFTALADIYLGIEQKQQCEKACDRVYHNLVKARQKLAGEQTGDDSDIEGYFSLFVEPSSIELWQDIIRYYLCLGNPNKALCSFNELEIEIQNLIELSPSTTDINTFKEIYNPFKIVFIAWGYNQLGYYQKGLDLLQSRNFDVVGFGEGLNSSIELLKMLNESENSDSPSKHLMQSLLEEFQNNQEQISSKIKEQEQMFIESIDKNDCQIFINELENHKVFFNSIFSNLRKLLDEEALTSLNLNISDKDKIYIPPLAIITCWQTGVSLLNLGEENRGRQLINSIKSVLAEGENKFSLQDTFERELVSLIQQS
ncbi:MAG: hypothetical protein SWZ49_09785 [Cyanobacteriota bacterium]|nr:hypothetical protein [Cyanobacteriota bacterium]